MLRFLRKYNKWLLAVFGSILMVVFLVPEAINRMAQSSGQEGAIWARIADGTAITYGEQREYREDLEVFDRLGLPVGEFGLMRDVGHWYLLVREATAAGVVPNRGSDALPPENAQVLFSAVGRTQVTERALGRWIGVQNLIQLHREAGKVSDRRLRREAERLFHGVDARVVVLRADVEGTPPVTDEPRLVEHFEKYRDRERGTAPGAFGYRLSDRVRLEYLFVSAEALRARVESTGGIDGVELAMHWRRNPSGNALFPPFDRNADIPDIVRDDLVRRRIEEVRNEAERIIEARLLESRRGLSLDPEGRYVLPEAWTARRVDFAALAAELARELPGLGDILIHADTGAWSTFQEVAVMPGLAGATTPAFGTPVGIQVLLRSMAEFAAGEVVTPTQSGVAFPLMTRTDGGLVIARVTAVDPARAPSDLSEVRERVAQDLRAATAWEALLARKDEILHMARTDGVLSMAITMDTEVQDPRQIVRFDPTLLLMQLQSEQMLPQTIPGSVPGLGPHTATIDAIVRAALAHRDTPDLTTLPPDRRIIAIPAEDELALTIAELFRHRALDRETYRSLVSVPDVLGLMMSEEIETLKLAEESDPFAFSTIAARNRFTVERTSEDGGAPAS